MLLLLLLTNAFVLLPWAGAGAGEYIEMGFRPARARAQKDTEQAISGKVPALPSLLSLLSHFPLSSYLSAQTVPKTSEALQQH